ncbi:MAG TPA: hypothetical protein VFO82_17640, partial [Steroidobacteraceae bacterium]|nr:hypothetical protein [Steroidobacteraceae bacterium]
MRSPTHTSKSRALAAMFALLLFIIALEAASGDQQTWQGAWRGQGSDADIAHLQHGRAQQHCLSKGELSERLDFSSRLRSRIILGLPDPWLRQLSDFDRGARLRTVAPVNTRQFLHFASRAALEWRADEIAEWTIQVQRLSRAARGLNVRLPPVYLVKTTGAEEFDSAYTRGRAIVIPQRLASLAVADQRRAFFLLAHELFHVLSRMNPAQREALYSLLGFERVGGFDYPEELEATRLSNPDAFEYSHALQVQSTTGPVDVLPVNQSRLPLAEAILLPSIFEALDIVLLAVDGETGEVQRDAGGELVRYHFGNTSWPPQMARNS